MSSQKRDFIFKSNIPASEFEEKRMANCSHTIIICQVLVMDTWFWRGPKWQTTAARKWNLTLIRQLGRTRGGYVGRWGRAGPREPSSSTHFCVCTQQRSLPEGLTASSMALTCYGWHPKIRPVRSCKFWLNLVEGILYSRALNFASYLLLNMFVW